ncbi:glycine oxidase ThiO [Staphylococcus sp. SQ8-PEA]|uniref:glycine oxidase n=1 Tax=Staphylococcus marylandisciuri TaxID=2981529 RepID=A0ABT2QQM4_9STAP|nr:glycine oxidase ThiO [Staphylococcus marylandisciuri]MCU5746278.1 glycine oxidase ThiO [Staphylococcus marylandisciuri]
MYDVIIVGSGVMGMSIARELSQNNLNVAVIDRDVAGKHASYKAGGMLGAQNEFTSYSPLYRLAREAQTRFEGLSESLKQEVGVDIEYKQTGLIKLAAQDSDNDFVEKQYHFLHQYNPSVELLSSQNLSLATHGEVDTRGLSAALIPDDHQINANKYTKALLKSLNKRDIHRWYQTEALNIESISNGYQVVTNRGCLTTEKVIVAGGAWSADLIEEPSLKRQVTGVKGEVLLVENKSLKLDTTIFMTNGCYIVPKSKHRYLIGATSLNNDYSVGVSEAGKQWLFHQACAKVPGLQDSKMIKHWSGIRPYTLNEQPIMDEIQSGLFIITGHYRNGILLSPLIGELMSEWLVNDSRPEVLENFIYKRGELNEVCD